MEAIFKPHKYSTKDNLAEMGWIYECGFGLEVDELKSHQMFLEVLK